MKKRDYSSIYFNTHI